jgi:hypothetical protein
VHLCITSSGFATRYIVFYAFDNKSTSDPHARGPFPTWALVSFRTWLMSRTSDNVAGPPVTPETATVFARWLARDFPGFVAAGGRFAPMGINAAFADDGHVT